MLKGLTLLQGIVFPFSHQKIASFSNRIWSCGLAQDHWTHASGKTVNCSVNTNGVVGTTVPMLCNFKWCCRQKLLQKQSVNESEHQCWRHLLDGSLELLTQNSEHRDKVITEGLYGWPFKQRRWQALDIGRGHYRLPQQSFPSSAFDTFRTGKMIFRCWAFLRSPKGSPKRIKGLIIPSVLSKVKHSR